MDQQLLIWIKRSQISTKKLDGNMHLILQDYLILSDILLATMTSFNDLICMKIVYNELISSYQLLSLNYEITEQN